MIANPNELRVLAHELSSAAWSLAAIGALFETGLADQLAAPRTLDELAAASPGLTARRIAAVLDVCAERGVVAIDGERYQLAPGVAPALCGPLRATLLGDLRSNLMQPLALLDRAGQSWDHADPALLEAQGDASAVLPAVIKQAFAPMLGDLAARLERPGARLLDVGTGVGALAIAACRSFPQLRVVGIDPAPVALALARRRVAAAELGDRIELRQLAAEALRDEAAFALAWLPAFFVPPDALPAAIARVAAALEPGGWLIAAAPGAGPVWQLVTETWGGPTASAEVEALLARAGLHEVRALPGPPWALQLLAGRR
ncbi:MAG TPA: class I SAM-dependent methyltransferase [Kofleriaceae bacterium]|nr:class I SAM-dependent methyltransferase [Kofleriaceae bacterium]